MLILIWLIGVALFAMALGGYRAYTLTKWDDRDRWVIALWPITFVIIALFWVGCCFATVGAWIGEWWRLKREAGE